MTFFPGFRTQARFLSFWGVVAATVFSAKPAHAYIDPNSVSMFLQLIVVAVAGGLWTLKVYWRRLRGFFGLNRQRDDTSIDTLED